MLLWKRYGNNKMAAILHLQQYSRRLNFFFFKKHTGCHPLELRLGHRYWQISNRLFIISHIFDGKCFQTKPAIKEEQRNQPDYYKRQQEIKQLVTNKLMVQKFP